MEKPNWLKKENVRITLDARPILASGEHPLARVMNEITGLNQGEIYEIITPFSPAPMIERIGMMGYSAFTEEAVPGEYHTYFCK